MNNKKYNIILEGTDGVGKTVTVKKLKEQGIDCKDRSQDIISKYMLFTVSLEERVKIYEAYLKNGDDIVIFLVNNDRDELMRRICSRDVISEFDLEAVEYNQLYLDTYYYMEENDKLYGKLFLVDCTNLTLEEQVEKVKKVINVSCYS